MDESQGQTLAETVIPMTKLKRSIKIIPATYCAGFHLHPSVILTVNYMVDVVARHVRWLCRLHHLPGVREKRTTFFRKMFNWMI